MINWNDCASAIYKKIKGTARLESKPSKEVATRLLKAYLNAKYAESIRKDARWKFSSLNKIEPSTSWEIKVVIEQRILNMP